MTIEKHVSVSSAKAKLLELLRQIEEEHENVVITKNGLPKAVLLNYNDFAGLLETVEILADPKIMRGIKAGLQDIKAGRVVRLEEAFKA
ncbi:MAG: type II toxin-antitoxin system Phd/YefM family antitoxin [Candidatus Binatia bacterium]